MGAVYLKSIQETVSGRRNKSAPVALFIGVWTETKRFRITKPETMFMIFMRAMRPIQINIHRGMFKTGRSLTRHTAAKSISAAVSSFAPPLVAFDLSGTKDMSPRVLAHDLGQALGCGASLEELRRTRCGRFSIDDAIGFMDLLKLDAPGFRARIIPMSGVRTR